MIHVLALKSLKSHLVEFNHHNVGIYLIAHGKSSIFVVARAIDPHVKVCYLALDLINLRIQPHMCCGATHSQRQYFYVSES